MNCLDFRRTLATEPACTEPDFVAHRERCVACRRAAAAATAFEQRLARALDVEPPADLERRLLLRQAFEPRPRRRLPLAAAAALLLAFGVGAMLPGLLDDDSLGPAVVHHVVAEPHAPPPGGLVDQDTLHMMLGAIGARVDAPLEDVRAAGLCAVRERTVAHLVLGEADTRMDVLVMPGETLDGEQRIRDGSRAGVMLPVEGGVLALLGEPGAGVERMRRRLQGDVSIRP